MESAADIALLLHRREPVDLAADARGLARLLVRGVLATTDLVEEVHAGIAGIPGRLLGAPEAASTRGIPRLVYRGIRGTTGLVGMGLDGLLARTAGALGTPPTSLRREALLAALNGVIGDHLDASGNPLALQARLRVRGDALDLDRGDRLPRSIAATPRLLVQVHGLCMNDLQWRRRGHDHGARLAADCGYTPVHLHYNSGLPIARNGQALSDLLQQLLDAWPVPVERIAILGHSMGGLVARAAIAAAGEQGQAWARQLEQVVFLGTPHHGAPLERAGNLLQATLAAMPWTAAFARLGQLRSAGIRDLRHGAPADGPPLPPRVRAYAIAGSLRSPGDDRPGRLSPGDGLVPVRSALGEHRDPGRNLRLPPARRLVVEGTGHLELLASPAVYARLRRWLA